MSRVVIFPTDTVYGIGCSIYDREAQLRIYKIKDRPLDKPLAVLCADLKQIEEIAYVDARAKKIIAKLMPGALTIILTAKEEIANITGFDTVGVRIPNYQVAIEVLHHVGAMTTTSVNDSGEAPLNDYNAIKEKYDDLVDSILPPSAEETSRQSSTVIDLTKSEIKVLREGEITLKQILKTINE